MKPEHDCNANSPTNQLARDFNASRKDILGSTGHSSSVDELVHLLVCSLYSHTPSSSSSSCCCFYDIVPSLLFFCCCLIFVLLKL